MILLSGRKKEAVEDSSVGLSHAADSDGGPAVHSTGGAHSSSDSNAGVYERVSSCPVKLVTLWSFRLRHPGL